MSRFPAMPSDSAPTVPVWSASDWPRADACAHPAPAAERRIAFEVVTDADLRVVDANPTYCRIVGVPLDELIGTVPPLLRPLPAGYYGTPLPARQSFGSSLQLSCLFRYFAALYLAGFAR